MSSHFFEKINEISDRYQSKIDQLMSFESDTKSALISFSYDVDKMLDYINSIEDENEKKTGLEIFSKKRDYLPQHQETLMEMFIVSAISILEAFLADMARELFKRDIRSLKSNKKLTYEELLEFSNTQELRDFIIEREILEFSHNSFKDQLNLWERTFGINLAVKEIKRDEIIEIFTTRNILLHNGGIINEAYLQNNPNSKLLLGDKRKIDLEYIVHVSSEVMSTMSILYRQILEKFKK